jgi:Cyclic-di-AMP receptor
MSTLEQVDVPVSALYNAAICSMEKVNAMKLLVFVTEHSAADPTVDALVEQGFRVTRLASTGGFLRKGNTTLLVGVEDGAVDRAIGLARRAAPGALVITLDLERYERV